MRPMLRVIAGFSAMFFVGGCGRAATWQTTYSSVPTLAPSETWSLTDDGAFAAPGMKLRVSAWNDLTGYRWAAGLVLLVPLVLPEAGSSSKPRQRPFKIQVTFDPEREDFTFDPDRVRLTVEKIAPMAPYDVTASCWIPAKERPIRLDPRPWPCPVWLASDVEPPHPEVEFTLLLEGLARQEVPLPPLRIRFKPSRQTRSVNP